MRIAIISDIHIGNTLSALIYRDSNTGKITIGTEKYERLKSSICQNSSFIKPHLDYLILLGDIFDFSVSSYDEAYALGKVFFQKLKDDEIADEIIYIPGNHDFDLWHTIEYQVNVINRIQKKHIPTQFRMSVPGVIDLRADSKKKIFTIPGISVQENQDHKYAGLFLDQITVPSTYFNFCYPNLYLITDKDSILVTHGQYLEGFWAFLLEELTILAADDLGLKGTIDLKSVVALNFPLCQLASSGIGQAGKLSDMAHHIQQEVYSRNLNHVQKYLDRLSHQLKHFIIKKYGKIIGKCINSFLPNWIKKTMIDKLLHLESTRYNQDFFNLESVKNRVIQYYKASLEEITQLNREYLYNIPLPNKIIFGHTHQPINWESDNAPFVNYTSAQKEKKISLYNTGGWVFHEKENDTLEFLGAEVFIYDSLSCMKSYRID